MSTFLYLMINSFIMLTQRKFIRFYTHTYNERHWDSRIYICMHNNSVVSSAFQFMCVCVDWIQIQIYPAEEIFWEVWTAGISYGIEYKMWPMHQASSSMIIISTVWFSQLLLWLLCGWCCCGDCWPAHRL